MAQGLRLFLDGVSKVEHRDSRLASKRLILWRAVETTVRIFGVEFGSAG